LLREILKINLKNMPWLKKLNIYSGHHAIGDKPLTANGIGGKECHVAGQEFGGPFCKKKIAKAPAANCVGSKVRSSSFLKK
jgi:hypothetical protein